MDRSSNAMLRTLPRLLIVTYYRDILLEEEAENLLPGMAPGGGAGGGRRRGRAGAPSGAAAGHREREFTGDSESDEDAERMVRIARL